MRFRLSLIKYNKWIKSRNFNNIYCTPKFDLCIQVICKPIPKEDGSSEIYKIEGERQPRILANGKILWVN